MTQLQKDRARIENILSQKTVAILGLGGLGSNIAIMLARSGLGHLILIDFDSVEQSNLNRQYYTLSQIGVSKTIALKDNIKSCCNNTQITLYNTKVTLDNCVNLTSKADIVCEAFDNKDTKTIIVQKLLEDTDKIIISGSGMSGLLPSSMIKTRYISKRLILCGDETSDYKENAGVFAPRVMLVASMQALETLRILTNN